MDGVLTPRGSLQGSLSGTGHLDGSLHLPHIPETFADVSGVTATAADVKQGKSFVTSDKVLTEGTYSWDFRGDRWEKVKDVYSLTTNLARTDFNTWTPSTTAKVILASSTADTFSADFSADEYLLHWKCQFDAAYNTGAVKKVQVYREVVEIWQALFRRPNSLDNIALNNHAGNACVTLATVPILVYYNSSGNLAYTWAASYGIYPSATAATFASTTDEQTTVTIKTPAYNARCSNTYFSTTRAAELDKANSFIVLKGELLRASIGGTERSLFDSLISLYNNPM